MSLVLRISAGRYRGRIIPAPPERGRQPRAFTPALVKEAFFQILINKGAGPDADFAFFDLCAASGQIILEALSRGYTNLHACEPDRYRFSALAKTLREYDEPVTMHARDLRRAGALLGLHTRTIAYLDPPYSFWKGPRCEPIETLVGHLVERWTRPPERLILVVQGPEELVFPPQFALGNASAEAREYRGTTLTVLDWHSAAFPAT